MRRWAEWRAVRLLVPALAAGLAACGSAAPRSSAILTAPVSSLPATSPSPTAAPATAPPAPDCAAQVEARLTPAQQVGQLLMAGVRSGVPDLPTIEALTADHAGGVLLDGSGWDGATLVRGEMARLQAVGRDAAAGVGLLTAANQEGGEAGSFQQAYGSGFSAIPAAIEQGGMAPAALQSAAATWGAQLRAAGITLDLAPVMDVVPAADSATNRADGIYGREYGHDDATVSDHAIAFLRGMHAAGVAVTLKHFPGLGHVSANTDFSSANITDTTTTADGPDVAVFGDGVAAGAEAVLVSLATYARIDASAPASFSPTVLDVLRSRLHFGGVILSDDLSRAGAVAAVPVGERAVRFIAAGGDVVVDSSPAVVPAMAAALLAQTAQDASFRSRVAASALRVLRLKVRSGLVPGCPPG